MAQTTFSGPVVSQNGFTGAVTGVVTLPEYTVATAPAASAYTAGTVIYVSNGAAGNPILAFSNGSDWLRSDTGGVIAAI